MSFFFDKLRTAWVKHDGILYKPAAVIVLGVDNDVPVFGKIEQIYIVNTNDIYFNVRILSTVEYNEHRHIFLVHTSNDCNTIKIIMLYKSFPLHFRRVNINGQLYLCIVLKYHIVKSR